jgi:hypothetical protein
MVQVHAFDLYLIMQAQLNICADLSYLYIYIYIYIYLVLGIQYLQIRNYGMTKNESFGFRISF